MYGAPTEVARRDNYLDFTTSPTNYPTANMTTFVSNLHANNQHYVVCSFKGFKSFY